jgi:DNA polymerase I-like protein with 3'-5' exonuclease and polymerase domains
MVLVGADADGLELRILSHYIGHFDEGNFAKTVVEGDVHQQNADLVGISRKSAKGMVFCLIYGGGDEKLGSTIDPTLKGRAASSVGKTARAKLMAGIPGLKQLTDMVQARSKDGTLKALDGRILYLQGKAHAALNYLCQSAGAIVTKAWLVKFYKIMDERYTLGVDYEPVSYIHDELNLSVRPELADEVITLLESTMRSITTDFNLNVQLSATGKSGRTWQDVH